MTRIIMEGQNSLHIDGYKGIVSFSDSTICIQSKNNKIEIVGKDLIIESFTGTWMKIVGVIISINWIT